MKRVTRQQFVTDEQAAEIKRVDAQVKKEFPPKMENDIKWRLFTLKRNWKYGLDFEYLLRWHVSRKSPPTLKDFETKYGDCFYIQFHKDDKIVELKPK